MTQIGWSETTFTSASSASAGDDEIRSLMTNIAAGLGESWYWPGSGAGQGPPDPFLPSLASSGELKLGSLRFARAGTSARTGGFPDGYLLLDTTRVSLHHIGTSGNTGFLAHSAMLDMGGGLSFPQTARWLYQEGSINAGSANSGSATVSFSSAYLGTPTVMLSTDDIGGARRIVGLSVVTSGGFTSLYSNLNANGSGVNLTYWSSEGTALF